MLRRLVAVLASAAVLLAASPALAHWCDCLWASGYNLVLRLGQDVVSVPASGSATVDVFIQNNMGYPLVNFVLYAESPGYAIDVTGPAPKVGNYLMPGEKLKRTLSISGTGGSLDIGTLDFYVSFGNSGQSNRYGTYGSPHNAVAIRKTGGTVVPSGFPGLGQGSQDQGATLQYVAKVDFGSGTDFTTGLADLVKNYCAGRGSWDSGRPASISNTYCPDTQIKACPPAVPSSSSSFTKYEVQHLWAASHLAARKSILGAYLPALRARLQCAFHDTEPPATKYMALFALGYLGDDPGARTFLEGLAAGTSDDAKVAKAALLMMGDSKYSAEVTACADPGGDLYVASACAGAVGIADKNDQKVQGVLLAKAGWKNPAEGPDNDPGPFFAAFILNIVSWDRRGYAVMAGDPGDPSYFNTGPSDTVAPKAPTGVGCTASAGGTLRVNWAPVTAGVDNNPEPAGVTYKVYSDTSAHAGCVHPGDAGCNYGHSDVASGIYRDFTGLDGTQTYRYRVTAVDAAGNEGDFSAETECKPVFAPVAALACTPATGDAPLDVTCDASASSDGNGASDIKAYAFKLDSGAEESGTALTKAYRFDVAGGHVVTLRVTDGTQPTALSATATATVTVNTPGNKAPTADAQGSPLTGPAPLTVAFDGSGSSDPEDGTNLTYSWDFGDGSARATDSKPSHAYPNAGTFTATLTVTDTGGASSTGVLTVRVTGNAPPDIGSASASPTSGAAPLTVHFDATGVTDPDGDGVTLTWDFGDGSAVSHAAAVDHTYAAAGTFTARLSAQDDGKPALGPAETTFTITPGQANRAPDCAKATVDPPSGKAPLTLHLDASGCTDPDNNKLTFEWHVPTTLTTADVIYTTAVADHEMTAAAAAKLPANPKIHLGVRDDGSPPLETNRDWPISITTGSDPGPDAGTTGPLGPISAGCGCSAASAPGGLTLALLALGLLRRKRG
ncbi:MAG TPA: PKD domain-containing protein [Myxococcales bacterium]|jgi:MYXO-CTERM domain-containing protein